MAKGIGTISDRIIDPFELRPEDINIWDIAWSLSQQNRYGGHTPYPWSVLSHTGLVFQLYVSDKRGKVDVHEGIWLLMHDAAEAYIQDICRPLKTRPEFAFFRELEDTLMEKIWKRLGYDPAEINSDLINRYDYQAAHIEGWKFFPGRHKWSYGIQEAKYDASDWYKKPLVVAKVQDFVEFLRQQLIVAGRCKDINQLFDLNDTMTRLVESAIPETATILEGDVKREILDRVPIQSNPILNARV